MNFVHKEENLAYHAARLLLLMLLCGKPRGGSAATLPAIEGRTLLAKLDFFIRYPVYLKKAAELLKKEFSDKDFGLIPDNEVHSVESRMVRYLYGPWDHIYYPSLAYLIGKQLIIIELKRGIETFRLTANGKDVAIELAQDPAYIDLAQRADTAYHLFNRYTGNGLKEFIYSHFPEVVSRKLGAPI
jgi:hypothetical protein